MAKRIFVSGSMAYDRIMDFPGRFADHILPEKIHVINLSFVVNDMVERPGGTAGNIAYALKLLGEEPTIVATIGRDYHQYFKWMQEHGISTAGLKVIETEPTASAFITTDQADNQITGFNPGAMKERTHLDFSKVDPRESIAIIAAGNTGDMAGYAEECRKHKVDFIFDPAQSLPAWTGHDLAKALDGARVLIANDYEMELVKTKTGMGVPQLLNRTEALIITKGENGSVVVTKEAQTHVPVAKLLKPAIDPTGAGDAFRAGVIKALLEGHSLIEGCRLGAVCAAYVVEVKGTQEYTFTPAEFQSRYATTFGAHSA